MSIEIKVQAAQSIADARILKELRMLPEQAEKSRIRLQENKLKGSHHFVFEDLKFKVCGGVFSPDIFRDAFPFTRRLSEDDIDCKNRHMLEVGCGTGLTGLYLLLRRGLVSLVASDVNEKALSCVQLNAELHGLTESVTTIKSDVYDSIPEDRRFDIIYWNYPWTPLPCNHTYSDVLERSVFDRGYEGLMKYIGGASRRLTPDGRIFLGFGDFGDIPALTKIANHFGYDPKSLLRVRGREDDPTSNIHFILYELCPKNAFRKPSLRCSEVA